MAGAKESVTKALWAAYWHNRSDEGRNALVVHYQYLVDKHAASVRVRLPAEVATDDLKSAGQIGLMMAVEQYDGNRTTKFDTYSQRRIIGAMLDELRQRDWVPRLTRMRAKRWNIAKTKLTNATGQEPDDAEMRKELRLTLQEFKRLKNDKDSVTQRSLSAVMFETDANKERRMADHLADVNAVDPSERIERRELITKCITGLNRAERLIIILYYFEEFSMREIGHTLDLSESRVSQMHSSILERLKARKENLQCLCS